MNTYAYNGSSPRPWGTPAVVLDDIAVDRFIPTPVGNTATPRPPGARGTVHPHARGEHYPVVGWLDDVTGSSPRPWGTQLVQPLGLPQHRFIPTPVGNTAGRTRAASSWAVHPHARGEHGRMSASCIGSSGSSPRPWGTHGQLDPLRWRVRFIPTPVGNTRPPDEDAVLIPVHPHARGEH